MLLLAHILASIDRSLAAPAAPTVAPDDLLLAEQDRLRRLVHRLLGWPGARSEVDDVVQDVLLAAWRHRQGFRGDSKLTTWLTRIAIRKVQHHLRWRRVRARFGLLASRQPDELPVAGSCAVTDGDDVRAMRDAMARLRADDRAVLVLRYLEDRPIDTIAEVLRCSRAAVDQRLTRARQRLRTLLPELEDA